MPIAFLLLLVGFAFAAPKDKDLGAVKAWPDECHGKKCVRGVCSRTLKTCKLGHWTDGVYYPDLCNTRSCYYQCDGDLTFTLETPTE